MAKNLSPPLSPSVPTFTPEERKRILDHHASKATHCRHYSYQRDDEGLGLGPLCAVGIDLSAPGASKKCWPTPENGLSCDKREERTPEEKQAQAEERVARLERMMVILACIPDGGKPSSATSGAFACPCCSGTVRWVRATTNRHLHARCSTAGCFGVMQ